MVLFDPDRLRVEGDENKGIEYVFVNGTLALAEGEPTGSLSGCVI